MIAEPGHHQYSTMKPTAAARAAPLAAPALSSSLSVRRMRSSGSVKGCQSPAMFSAASSSKKKNAGGGFEPTEPTSPKVTCIGQVRVKTSRKKQNKNNKKKLALARSVSRRAAEGEVPDGGGGGRVCFRSQRWVHLGMCEAVSCFYPCGRQPQCSPEPGKRKGKGACGARIGSCGTAFSRWLMAVHESEELEIVVEEEDDEAAIRGRGSRRELESVADELEKKGAAFAEENGWGELEAAAEVCVPPPNALLLMRCRSDPVKMAALESRFWGSPVSKFDEAHADDEEEEEKGREDDQLRAGGGEEGKREERKDIKIGIGLEIEAETVAGEEEENREVAEPKQNPNKKKDGSLGRRHSFSVEKKPRRSSSFREEEGSRRFSFSSFLEPRRSSCYLESFRRAEPVEKGGKQTGEERFAKELPDCLLLMMYEPKLSMEVSKETWVCSADFVRPKAHLQHHPRCEDEDDKKPGELGMEEGRGGESSDESSSSSSSSSSSFSVLVPREEEEEGGGESKEAPSVFLNREVQDDAESEGKAQPPSAPAEPAKLAAFGPFVLTRCKSDPAKASAKISPEVGFWRSRHQPIGAAAEVGF